MQERNVDAYLDSRKLNIDCKNAIEQAIAEGFDGMRLNPDVAVGMVKKYGKTGCICSGKYIETAFL